MSALRPGVDLTVFTYFDSQGGGALEVNQEAYAIRDKTVGAFLERTKAGTLREYKRIICFDDEALANAPELKSGTLRVGEGAGTIDRPMGEHCRLMMKTKGCSLFVAPAILQNTVIFYGTEKVLMTLETAAGFRGGRRFAGALVFCDPPNSEIIEEFRQIERATERRMVAVHRIRFPEDEAPTASLATRSPATR